MTTARDVRDVYGRRYRVGEDPRELTGRSRSWQLWTAWACLVAISPLQYSFGVTALGLQDEHGWGLVQTMWLLALFVACQAIVAVPVARVHRQRRVTPAHLVVLGGALAAVGLISLAHTSSYGVALAGYALIGGVGAGIVYSACITTAARWFPERRTATIGFVTGGFACGAVPSILLLQVWSSTLVFDLAAAIAVGVVLVAAKVLKDPPPHWWPAELDAQAWAVDRKLNRSYPHNQPAVRHYAPGEAFRTGALPLMWLALAMSTAISLFGIAFVFGYGVEAGVGATTAGVAAAMLAAVNGFGRSTAGHLSDRFGRRRVLAAVFAVEGVTHVGLALAGGSGIAWLFVVCAMFAGLGGGAFYAIMANLVLEYFGENSLLQNQAVLYSAKAFGGLLGVGAAASLVVAVGYQPVFVVAGILGLVAALPVRFLRQPGRHALAAEGPQLGQPVVAAIRPGE